MANTIMRSTIFTGRPSIFMVYPCQGESIMSNRIRSLSLLLLVTSGALGQAPRDNTDLFCGVMVRSLRSGNLDQAKMAASNLAYELVPYALMRARSPVTAPAGEIAIAAIGSLTTRSCKQVVDASAANDLSAAGKVALELLAAYEERL